MTSLVTTDDEAALLRTALSSGAEASRHWATFTSLFDFDDIWDAERYGLLPAVHLALGGVEAVDAGPRLAGIHRKTWVANHSAVSRCVADLAALDDAGVPACAHGELPVALTLHPAPARRVVDTVEILVAVEDAPAAVEVLGRSDWRPVVETPLARLVDALDGVVLVRGDVERVRVVWETCRGVADSVADRARVPAVIASADAVATEHGPLRITPAADVAVHAACAGVGVLGGRRLRSLLDVAAHLDAPADGADADSVAGIVDRLAVATVVLRALTDLVDVADVEAGSLRTAVGSLSVSSADRRRHELLIRAAADPGAVHPLRVHRARRAVGTGPVAAALMLPDVMTATWDLPSAKMLPVEIPRRALAKASRALKSRSRP